MPVNSILRVQGFVQATPTAFVLDSGAAISVIRYDKIPSDLRKTVLRCSDGAIVGANGLPLQVEGNIELAVNIGEFNTNHRFTVVQHLTVDCLLGANFLTKYDAVIDCMNRNLHLGPHSLVTPISTSSPRRDKCTSIKGNVTVPQNIQIPSRTVLVIAGNVGHSCFLKEVIVEPGDNANIPNHVLIAHSVSRVDDDHIVLLQVMNTSPDPITLYKGARIATWSSHEEVTCMTVSGQLEEKSWCSIDLNELQLGNNLSTTQRKDLHCLLSEFHNLFHSTERPPGHTSVVNETTGPPIRQPLRRLPIALKDTVIKEVDGMIKNGVIRDHGRYQL